jgi:glyoxylase-like metal-dependent hydrolase (beta-lactamase superfamily II)
MRLRCFLMSALMWVVLPLAGLGQALAADEPPMDLLQVAPNTHYVQGLSQMGSTKNQNFISNAGFVVTPAGVVVVDALGSPRLAERLTSAIRSITPLPITHVVVTHYHADHIYGLQHFKAMGAQVVAHRSALAYIQSDTARLRLEASRTDLSPWVDEKTQIVNADLWIDGPTSFKVGGVVFEVDHVGPSHTPEDLTVYVPSERVLFAGDLFFNGRLPFVGMADSSQWIRSLERVLAHDAAVVVPGHGAASTQPRQDIGMTRDYLQHLRSSMARAVEDFVPFEEAYATTNWSAFEATPMFPFANRMNAYNTYLLLEQEALGKKR